jgi:hypothetical protein
LADRQPLRGSNSSTFRLTEIELVTSLLVKIWHYPTLQPTPGLQRFFFRAPPTLAGRNGEHSSSRIALKEHFPHEQI